MTDDTSPGSDLSRVTPAQAPATSGAPGTSGAAPRPPLSAPPPRPPMSNTAAAPITPITGPSALMRTARAIWALSVIAGIVALVVAFLRRTDQFPRTATLIDELAPGYDAETVDSVAAIAFWGTFGVLAVFLLVELMLRAPSERRAGARWAMFLVLLLHGAFAAATISFLALDAEGTSTQLLVLAQLVLAVLALLLTAIAAAITRRRQPVQASAKRRR